MNFFVDEVGQYVADHVKLMTNLQTIAESLANARRINEKLPRHVIAQYYIHALDEYIKQQPGLNAEEIKERVKNLEQILLFSREGND